VAFLRKHYEKMILAAFLLVFIFLLVSLIMIFSKSMEISEKDLMITPREANCPRVSPDAYQARQTLGQQVAWEKAAPRTEGSSDYTALLTPFEISRCPSDKGCGRFIPLSAFGSEESPGKCPLCGIPLDPPKVVIGPTGGGEGEDRDNDGIPDMIEVKYGLNPANPADAHYDLDGDGFTNLYEHLQGTELNDPKSRPPLAHRLSLKDIRRRQLPMILKKVVARDGDEKDRWDIQLDAQTPRGMRTRFERLGNTIKLDNDEYKIIDVDHRIEERRDRRLNSTVPTDVSRITIQKGDEEPIVAIVGEKIMEPNPRILILDQHANREYNLRQDDEFTVGTASTGTEKYRLVEVDDNARTVILKDAAEALHTVGVSAKAPIPQVPGLERMQPGAPIAPPLPGGMFDDVF
jgi:hypothetical protein